MAAASRVGGAVCIELHHESTACPLRLFGQAGGFLGSGFCCVPDFASVQVRAPVLFGGLHMVDIAQRQHIYEITTNVNSIILLTSHLPVLSVLFAHAIAGSIQW